MAPKYAIALLLALALVASADAGGTEPDNEGARIIRDFCVGCVLDLPAPCCQAPGLQFGKFQVTDSIWVTTPNDPTGGTFRIVVHGVLVEGSPPPRAVVFRGPYNPPLGICGPYQKSVTVTPSGRVNMICARESENP
eukprot:tig00020564_g11443.t1